MPSGAPGDEKVSKVVKTDSTDGQTARSELLILCHEPPERCSVPRCARCHCKWDNLGSRREQDSAEMLDARWLIVKATCIVGRALAGRQWAEQRIRTETKSLIHLRFWKVQSTTVQGLPAIPGQLTVPYNSSSTCCAATNQKKNISEFIKVLVSRLLHIIVL